MWTLSQRRKVPHSYDNHVWIMKNSTLLLQCNLANINFNMLEIRYKFACAVQSLRSLTKFDINSEIRERLPSLFLVGWCCVREWEGAMVGNCGGFHFYLFSYGIQRGLSKRSFAPSLYCVLLLKTLGHVTRILCCEGVSRGAQFNNS